ncbi:hypothetical protein Tco_0700769 [Tanacetum coccineum]
MTYLRCRRILNSALHVGCKPVEGVEGIGKQRVWKGSKEQGSCNDIVAIQDLTCIINMKYGKLELTVELETRINTLVDNDSCSAYDHRLTTS